VKKELKKEDWKGFSRGFENLDAEKKTYQSREGDIISVQDPKEKKRQRGRLTKIGNPLQIPGSLQKNLTKSNRGGGGEKGGFKGNTEQRRQKRGRTSRKAIGILPGKDLVLPGKKV